MTWKSLASSLTLMLFHLVIPLTGEAQSFLYYYFGDYTQMPDLLIPLLQDIFLSFATVTQKIILLTTAKQKYLVQK
jgi:hypothetical protein